LFLETAGYLVNGDAIKNWFFFFIRIHVQFAFCRLYGVARRKSLKTIDQDLLLFGAVLQFFKLSPKYYTPPVDRANIWFFRIILILRPSFE